MWVDPGEVPPRPFTLLQSQESKRDNPHPRTMEQPGVIIYLAKEPEPSVWVTAAHKRKGRRYF